MHFYRVPFAGFDLTTLVMIGTDCTVVLSSTTIRSQSGGYFNKIGWQNMFKSLFPEWKLILLWRTSLLIIYFFHWGGGRGMLNVQLNYEDTKG